MVGSAPMSEKNERVAALDFAARIKVAVGRKRDEQKAKQEAEKARRARIAAALKRLFDDLEAMGRAAEVLEVDRRKLRVKLRLDGREIHIESKPDKERPDHIEIRATGVEHEDGMIGNVEEDQPEGDKIAAAVDVLDGKFDPEDVTLYLSICAEQWPQVTEIQETWKARVE